MVYNVLKTPGVREFRTHVRKVKFVLLVHIFLPFSGHIEVFSMLSGY